MRAGHAAHLDSQAALELARETRPAANARGAAFALATPLAGALGAASGGAAGAASISMRDDASHGAALVQRGAASAALPGDHASASSEGSLLSQLQQLSQSDPAKFQQAAAAIADQLQSTADAASGANAKALAPLVSSFRASAATGLPPALGNLGAADGAGSSPNINLNVLRYAQGNSAAAGDFALSALHSAIQRVLA